MKNDLTPGIVQQADIITQQIRDAQELAAIKNAAIRQAERQEKMDAWQDPEMMQYRRATIIKRAMESLWSIRASGQAEPETPLPSDSELPPHMRGQQPSTVRAWIRSEPEWQERIKEHRKKAQVKKNDIKHLLEKYPELAGADDSEARMTVDFNKFKPTRAYVPYLENFIKMKKRMCTTYKAEEAAMPTKISWKDRLIGWFEDII